MTTPGVPFYQTGAALHLSAPSYVVRACDDALFSALQQGILCYVLTARQLGKSTLMARTAQRLREQGHTVLYLDLTMLGANLSLEQWYRGLIERIGHGLNLEDELDDFFNTRERLGPLQRFSLALRQVVAPQLTQPLTIFVDEVDKVLALPFSTDEFFAAIRELYTARAEEPALSRLTFCLAGVVSPAELIRDTRTTPFNVGQRIELSDFTPAEARHLAVGLNRPEPLASRLLDRILYWTGGHPYLTQQLCARVAEEPGLRRPREVDGLCRSLFLTSRAREQEKNLAFIPGELACRGDPAAALELYAQLLRGWPPVQDDVLDPRVTALLLSGLARVEGGRLRVRNRIYRAAFDRAWIRLQLTDAELERQRRARMRGIVGTAAVAALIIVLLGSLAFIAQGQRDRAITAQLEAQQQRTLAEQQREETRRVLYDSQLKLAQEAVNAADCARAMSLLDETRPRAGEADLRGFEWYYLWRQCHLETVLVKLPKPGRAVAFSPDGRLLAVVGKEGQVSLRDGHTGQERARLEGHLGEVQAVAFSPDGRTLATGSVDRTVRLWHVLEAGSALEIGHPGPVSSLDFSPDGRMLITGTEGGMIHLFDVSRGAQRVPPVLTLAGRLSRGEHTESRDFCSAHPADPGCLRESALAGWRPAVATTYAPSQPDSERLMSIRFSPDGRLVATASLDHTVRVFDPFTQAEVGYAALEDRVTSVRFSGDGKRLLATSADGTSTLWALEDAVPQAKMKSRGPEKGLLRAGALTTPFPWRASLLTRSRRLVGHQSVVRDAVFSGDDRYLVTAGRDGTLRVWDSAGQLLSSVGGHLESISALARTQAGDRLASISSDGELRIWALPLAGAWESLPEGAHAICQCVLSPDGQTLLTDTRKTPSQPYRSTQPHEAWRPTLDLWDIRSRTLVGLYEYRAGGNAHALAFSPDGQRLMSGGPSQTHLVQEWERAGRLPRKLLELPSGREVRLLVPTGEGYWLVAEYEGTLELYARGARQPFARIPLPAGVEAFGPLLVTPDGRELVSGAGDQVMVWDLQGNLVKRLAGHTRPVRALAFSADGRLLASGAEDGTARLWDWASGKWLYSLEGHRGPVSGLRFLKGGKRLACGAERSIRVWDLTTRREVLTLPSETPVDTVLETPDGRQLITGAYFAWNSIRFWVAAGPEATEKR